MRAHALTGKPVERRMPLLREVVAESLRVVLEPEDVERVPLPGARDTLFELLCLVRIARSLAPPPDELRWLDLELSQNRIELPGLRCHYQRSLGRHAVLACREYRDGLAESIAEFSVGVPERIDLTVEFTGGPRHGVHALVIEVKSGQRRPDDAVEQLKVYRAAFPRDDGHRLVAWAIVECAQPLTEAQMAWLREKRARRDGDVWLFSGPDDIARVLAVMFPDDHPDASHLAPREGRTELAF